MSSKEIIEGFLNNDSKVLGFLYQNQYPKLKHFVITNNGSNDQAKDVFQDAFIIVWTNIKKGVFTPQNGSELNGYLYRIAKNKWIDYLRSSGYKKSVLLENYHDKTDDRAEDREPAFRLIENGLKTLGEKCRDLLKRFYYKKESMAEIADSFGWTEQTARNNKYRCIQQLRSEMSKLNNGRNEL